MGFEIFLVLNFGEWERFKNGDSKKIKEFLMKKKHLKPKP
jgi:hypothetical protein